MTEPASDPAPCPECGEPVPEGGCWTRVHEILEIEQYALPKVESEEGLRAHFFAIGTYQLQHPSRSTVEALAVLREAVASMVESPRPIRDLRGEMRRHVRGTRVGREAPPGDRTHVDARWPTTWTMTARDVIASGVDGYTSTVADWAAATVADLDRAMGVR